MSDKYPQLNIRLHGKNGRVELDLSEIVAADNYSKKNPTFNNAIIKSIELYKALEAKDGL